MLHFSLSLDNSVCCVSAPCYLLPRMCVTAVSFSPCLLIHTHIHVPYRTVYLYFFLAIMLLVSTHSIHATWIISRGDWTTGYWGNLKGRSLMAAFFHSLSCATVDNNEKKRTKYLILFQPCTCYINLLKWCTNNVFWKFYTIFQLFYQFTFESF